MTLQQMFSVRIKIFKKSFGKTVWLSGSLLGSLEFSPTSSERKKQIVANSGDKKQVLKRANPVNFRARWNTGRA